MTNQGKLLKTYLELFCLFIYLDLFFIQELTLAQKNIFIAISFYRNIVCQNVSCE